MKSKCNLCEKSFTLIFAFQQHLKAVHGLGNSGQEDRDEIDLCSDDEDPADSSSDSSTEEFLQNVHQQMTELLQKSMCGGDLEPELQGENAERNDETEAEDVDASMQDDEEEEEEIDENKVVYEQFNKCLVCTKIKYQGKNCLLNKGDVVSSTNSQSNFSLFYR